MLLRLSKINNFTFCHWADTFNQSDLQVRHKESKVEGRRHSKQSASRRNVCFVRRECQIGEKREGLFVCLFIFKCTGSCRILCIKNGESNLKSHYIQYAADYLAVIVNYLLRTIEVTLIPVSPNPVKNLSTANRM